MREMGTNTMSQLALERPQSRRVRRGFSLLELLAVVTFMGILASVVIARNGRSLLSNFSSGGDCRRISLAMLSAKRRAITTGLEHAVRFTGSGNDMTFSVVSIDSFGSATVVDGPMSLQDDLTIATSHSQMSFNFEGQAGGAYWVTLTGPRKIGRIDVIPITGTVQCSESSH
jgi:prepilin-type N-terminal cleavage/methylation domain-containing protein